MPDRKLKTKYNKCKLCGTFVVRGITTCPSCHADIIDQYGIHAFIFQRSDSAVGALIGFVLGWIPPAVVMLLLADPTVGYLDLSDDMVTTRLVTYGCPLLGIVIGWFWSPIRRLLRGE